MPENDEILKTELASRLEALRDRLADIEHERWSHWQKYMHGKCEAKQNGDLVIPAEFVAQWSKQSETSFQQLTEAEKNSDRDQVERYLPLIISELMR